MSIISSNGYFCRTFLCFLLFVFTLTSIIPLNASQPFAFNNKDAEFVLKLKKIFKTLEGTNKTTKDAIHMVVDFKQAIENYTGKKVDMKAAYKSLDKEFKDNGVEGQKTEIGSIKGLISKREKHLEKKKKKLFSVISLEGYLPDEFMIPTEIGKKDKKEEEHEESEIPFEFTVSVVTTLCGVFLICIPIPLCKTWGNYLLKAGVEAAVLTGAAHMDNKRKKENEKKKIDE